MVDSKQLKIKWLIVAVVSTIIIQALFIGSFRINGKQVRLKFQVTTHADSLTVKNQQIKSLSDSLVQLYKLIEATEQTIKIQEENEKAIERKYATLDDSTVIRQFTERHPGSRLIRIVRDNPVTGSQEN